MGADDGNEGTGTGECVEHVWAETAYVLTLDGASVDKTCQRCEAVTIEVLGITSGRVRTTRTPSP